MADSGQALAHRLRQLRLQQWPGRRVKQPQLAQALNVSVPLISSWENEGNPKVPPVSRLEAYALIFCSRRSLRDDDLVPVAEDELTAEESQLRDKLLQELLDLRAAALDQRPSSAVVNPWQFDDGKQVVIVCARLPGEWLARMPYVDPDDPHHIELYTYADLDALFELHGHIRAFNPASEVRRHTPDELEPDDLTSHLVLLGGVDWNDLTTNVFQDLGLPVEQVNDWDGEHGPYFSSSDRRFHPKLSGGRLREDVALFYRGENPYNAECTLTICNGMYGRGTLGVARALTDVKFRDRNTAWLQERFGGHEAYALLSKVRVVNGKVITPDWTLDELRLVEWPG
ncbi:XRE family transcriptional regulator [Nonomuraea sp. NPDC049486]|uniref:helix-turn-helix domain-containing protein n=1 Tax=unclassified Nonomuraea TaxID=2593643 RepID=UPI003448E01F